ncbi:MAG TPA: hypothetical protein VK031_07800, partial [Tissierellaceae bacterium]|nr:hypothetical protein [Tissierellaceae bacterium]
MNTFSKITKKHTFKLLSIFLLLFSMISSSFPQQITFAESDPGYQEGHGSIRNDQGEIDYDEATINKVVSFGNIPGEYF